MAECRYLWLVPQDYGALLLKEVKGVLKGVRLQEGERQVGTVFVRELQG